MANRLDALFVYPPTGWTPAAMRIAENDAPPLGLLYVAAAAQEAGLDVSVVDMNHPAAAGDRLAEIIEQQRPRIVAFSVLTPSAEQTKSLARMIKTRFPDVRVVAGGVHATALPGDLLQAGVDYVVQGEGETAFVELARTVLAGGEISSIGGLAYLRSHSHGSDTPVHELNGSSEIATTRQRGPHASLDDLPLPARDLVPLLDYGQPGAVSTSRGCPYACCFCSSVLSGGHNHRLRSVDAVLDEIASLHTRYGLSRFQFLDDNFAAVPERAMELAAHLAGRGYVWSCQTSVMELAEWPHLIGQMHAAGCRQIYFGLESGSRRILEQYKSIDPDRAMAVLAAAAALGKHDGTPDDVALQTVVGFMVGHPDDDEASVEETVDFALKLRRLGVDTMIGVMQPYPGSLIYRDPSRYGLTIENHSFSDYLYPRANMSTRWLARERISTLYASGLYRIMQTYE